jgi:hypothetical protein
MLSKIFIHVSTSYDSISDQGMVPLLLGQICSRWRSVSLETPSLWSSLHLKYDKRRDPDLTANDASIWMSRSGKSMLSLSVEFDGYSPVSSACQFFKHLAASSPRWRALSLTTTESLMHKLFSMVS